MMIAELFDRETQLRRDKPFDMPDYPVHDGLARAGTSPEEYVRITTERIKTGAKTLFFPGCNVYKQPDKLLCALFLLDACGEEYSFLPGMKHCCGWTPGGCAGDAESLQERAEQLMARIEGSGASQAVFWCPTCLCIIKEKMRHFLTPSVNCVTFGEYIAAHVGRLSFPAAGPHKIALHDPCKSAYLGIDIDPGSVRTLLRAIPGTELVEMPRHGRNTVCCGCDAVPGVPEVGARVTEERLREAAATGADTLIDICHNCHWIFKPAQKRMESAPEASALRIVNYATYIAAAMGMERPDSL
jgi:Fe-S oxidoreductase